MRTVPWGRPGAPLLGSKVKPVLMRYYPRLYGIVDSVIQRVRAEEIG